MKILSRDFTTREKIVLIVLAVILLALCYYQFVLKPVSRGISAANEMRESAELELDLLDTRLTRYTGMQAELEQLIDSGEATYMASYNNSEAELQFLNDLLSNTLKYNISFSNLTRNGDQIRRSFKLDFTTNGYDEMGRIISRLSESELRCLIGTMNCQVNERDGTVSSTVSATFFETLVGGTPDAGLPADPNAAAAEDGNS